jgi:hypothetical protein
MPHLEPLKASTPQPKVKASRPAQPKGRRLTLPKRDPRARRSR